MMACVQRHTLGPLGPCGLTAPLPVEKEGKGQDEDDVMFQRNVQERPGRHPCIDFG